MRNPQNRIRTQRAAIDTNWAAYETSREANDLDVWLSLWTDDGVQLPPGEPMVVGKVRLKDRNGRILEMSEFVAFEISNEETAIAADRAWSRGTYTATVAAVGDTATSEISGKFLSIFNRNDKGESKLHRDIFNVNTPPGSK